MNVKLLTVINLIPQARKSLFNINYLSYLNNLNYMIFKLIFFLILHKFVHRMEVIKSERGKEKLLLGGYAYYESNRRGNIIYR